MIPSTRKDHLNKKDNEAYLRWSIGTINVLTASDDLNLQNCIDLIHLARLDIACLQEVRRLNTGSVTIKVEHDTYDVYHCGMIRNRMQGVAIVIRQDPAIHVLGIHNIGPRLMALDISQRGLLLRVIAAYAPTETSPLSTKKSFYCSLQKLYTNTGKYQNILQGDLNATCTLGARNSNFDGGSNQVYDNGDTANENGNLFIDFCITHKLSILNSWFRHRDIHRITWHSNDGVTKKVLDYSCCQSWLRQFVTDCRVRNSYRFGNSDHRLVITKLTTPANKRARCSRPLKRKCSPKVDLQSITDASSDTRKKFATALKSAINESLTQYNGDTNDINMTQKHHQLVSAIDKAKEVLPVIHHKDVNPWDEDRILLQLLNERRVFKANPSKLQELNIQIKTQVKALKNEHMKKQANAINEARVFRNTVQEWRRAKEHSNIVKRKPKPIPCKGLKEHFIAHFNPNHSTLKMPLEIDQPPNYITLLQNSSKSNTINNDDPTDKEIENAIIKLKLRKTSLDIPAEALRAGYEECIEFKELVVCYFRKVWSELEVPDQWSLSRLTALWKNKGSARDPTMYRGLNVGSLLPKIAMNIVLKRMSTFYEATLLRTQFGFRSGKGCNDGIYAIKQLQDVSYKSQRKLYTCYVDLTAAYDHIPRKFMFQSIRNRLPPGEYKCLDIIEKLYEKTRSFMKGDKEEDSFECGAGVRQGGNESGMCYNLYSDYAIRVWQAECLKRGLPTLGIQYVIPNEATNREQRAECNCHGTVEDCECGFADDTGIHSWNLETLQTSVQLLYDTFARFGLHINISKTETMIWNWNEEKDGPYPSSIISINETKLKNVKEFKYLGVWNTYNNIHIGEREVNYRIGSAAAAYSKHRQLLTNRNIWLSTRVKFLNAYVRSRLTYGCQSWRPTQKELNKLDAIYNSYLRRIITGGYRRKNPPPKKKNVNETDDEPPVEDELTGDNELLADEEPHTYEEQPVDYDMSFVISNERLYDITGQRPLRLFFHQQQENWMKHVIRQPNSSLVKALTFESVRNKQKRINSILYNVVRRQQLEKGQFIRDAFKKVY